MCAVHAGVSRRKGGDTQCVVVLVHKEEGGCSTRVPLVCWTALWGSWRSEGVVRHARAMDFGLPLVAAFNR